MKEKVLIRAVVPMADLACDFRIPYSLNCTVVASMLADMFQKNNHNALPIHKPPLLWSCREGKALDGAITLLEAGVMESDQLLLI